MRWKRYPGCSLIGRSRAPKWRSWGKDLHFGGATLSMGILEGTSLGEPTWNGARLLLAGAHLAPACSEHTIPADPEQPGHVFLERGSHNQLTVQPQTGSSVPLKLSSVQPQTSNSVPLGLSSYLSDGVGIIGTEGWCQVPHVGHCGESAV